jgi:ribosome-binding factor A
MGKASERRTERVKSLLLSTISDIIRDELSDPRIGIFSMTDLHLAKDLSTAEVMIAAVGGKLPTEECVKALNGAAPLIWNRLRHETDLRNVPKLRFTGDFTGEYSDQVFQTLEALRDKGELVLWEDDHGEGEDEEEEETEGVGPSPHPGELEEDSNESA